MAKIFITSPIEEIGLNLLREHEIETVTNDQSRQISPSHLKEIFAKYDGIITMISDKIDEGIINCASAKFKIIANYGVGFDNIDVMSAKRKGIIVCNTPGVAGASAAEHTFALILACSKNLIEADRYVREGKYTKWDSRLFVSHQLSNQTIGILGLGGIGASVGKIAFGGFGLKVIYNDIVRSHDFEMLAEAKAVSFNELLRDSDIISIHMPLTHKTKYLIGYEQLKMMKNSAILINTGRGQIIDQDALIRALKEKVIKAAGLDVYEEEFQVPHELRTLGNVVLTPHIASATSETRNAMSKITAENIIDVFSGTQPMGLVRVE